MEAGIRPPSARLSPPSEDPKPRCCLGSSLPVHPTSPPHAPHRAPPSFRRRLTRGTTTSSPTHTCTHTHTHTASRPPVLHAPTPRPGRPGSDPLPPAPKSQLHWAHQAATPPCWPPALPTWCPAQAAPLVAGPPSAPSPPAGEGQLLPAREPPASSIPGPSRPGSLWTNDTYGRLLDAGPLSTSCFSLER